MCCTVHAGYQDSALQSLTWYDVDIEHWTTTIYAGGATQGESRGIPCKQLLTDIWKSVTFVPHRGKKVF
jgi:hypothetical protein